MPVKKLHFAPNDFLHAASVVALADTACGYATMAHLPPQAPSFTTIELAVIADKAYDAQARVLDVLTQAGQTAVIPPSRSRIEQRSWDRDLYRAHHLIENFFAKLKQYRTIATRYDKMSRNFLGAIHLAAAVVWLS